MSKPDREARSAATSPDAADVFTVDELWMLYGIAAGEVTHRERAEREAFADLGSGPWRSLKAKLRLQIERQVPRAKA